MKRAAAITLLCLMAGLAGCAGDRTDSGEQTENIPVETLEGTPVGEGQSGVEQSGTNEPDAGDWSTDQSAAGRQEDLQQTAGEEDSVADNQPVQEPFVDKLTEEGKGWGLSFGESGTQPVGNASPEELKQYNAYFIGDDSEKVIYLTFDCGYENGNTEAILDALKEHNAQGTFFVVGHYLETAPDLVKRMVEEGHAVGSHTYHHPDINTLPDMAAFQEEMDSLRELFTEVTGEELDMYYRPPEGKCGITNLKMAQELGYTTIFWSLAHVDWDVDNQPSHAEAIEKLTDRIHPGAIVLLHNTSQTNGEILDELLTKWEEMGYRFAPLSDL